MLICEGELLERENDAITQSNLPKHTFSENVPRPEAMYLDRALLCNNTNKLTLVSFISIHLQFPFF